MNGFCSQLLPTDRSHFSTEDGLTNRPKESFQLPSEDLWVWESEWQLENTFNNELLDEGKKCIGITFFQSLVSTHLKAGPMLLISLRLTILKKDGNLVSVDGNGSGIGASLDSTNGSKWNQLIPTTRKSVYV